MSLITKFAFILDKLSEDGPPGLIHPLLIENYDWVDRRLDELYYNYTNTTYEYLEDEHIKFNTPRSVTSTNNNDDDDDADEELCENQLNICENEYLTTDVSELTEEELYDCDSDDWYMYGACIY